MCWGRSAAVRAPRCTATTRRATSATWSSGPDRLDADAGRAWALAESRRPRARPARRGLARRAPGAAAPHRLPAAAADRPGRPARLLRVGLAAGVRGRRGARRAGAARSPALALDDRGRAAARRARARRSAARRGDRRRGAVDEPALAHPPAPGALRARRARDRVDRRVTAPASG